MNDEAREGLNFRVHAGNQAFREVFGIHQAFIERLIRRDRLPVTGRAFGFEVVRQLAFRKIGVRQGRCNLCEIFGGGFRSGGCQEGLHPGKSFQDIVARPFGRLGAQIPGKITGFQKDLCGVLCLSFKLGILERIEVVDGIAYRQTACHESSLF